jgi:23S rRNA pseudouridine1911/1915/1917 synthase
MQTPPPPLAILYEDNHCLALNKPTGLSSAHFQGEDETLDRLVKSYLKNKYQKPGNVFLGVVQRLDKRVSGVLLFARTSKAAARLSEQFREGTVEKFYWAIVEGELAQESGALEDWLRKDPQTGCVEVLPPGTPGAKQARLRYRRRARYGGLSWLEVQLLTGRRHQLRVQLARLGHPIVGDARYGARHTFGGAVALHARTLTFQHPIRHEPITLTASLPRAWGRFAHLLEEVPP